ncbi:MAG TPA: trehalose-6-phosphate synthase [Thermomicrobiales bacterium]|nr:trehalose-6-phosphate synthase [Thermomicrobiales bacterium]
MRQPREAIEVPGTNSTSTEHHAGNGHESDPGAFEALISTTLDERPLIVASNRGPVTFSAQSDGSFTARQGSGGLVTAVSAVLQDHQAIWIAAAMTEGDRDRAATAERQGETLITPHGSGSRFKLRFVVPDEDAYHQYYNVISNPLLWFLQHYLWDTPRAPDITHETWRAWREGYVAVNREFADEILVACEQSAQEPIIMLQDYQLYLCGQFIREKRPNAIVQHFIHIPWPDPDYWRLLPMEMRTAICQGLLGCDIVGFQTPAHARSFMYTCEAYVPGAEIDYANHRVTWNGRMTSVRAYPISIDAEAVRRTAYSQEARAYERYLPTHWNEFTILRTDRAEPSKNIIRGFVAFDRFLEMHPEFRDRVNFIAVTQPSRMDVEEYRNYLDDVSAIVGRINAKYANVETGWQPIQLIMGEKYARVLAAMKWYDLLMVNSIIDGMALVAKEGALVNERSGVLLLSEGAGAVEQLGEHALVVAPADIEGTAEAIYQALTMPIPERQRRALALKRLVERDDVTVWFRDQLADIARLEQVHQPGPQEPAPAQP